MYNNLQTRLILPKTTRLVFMTQISNNTNSDVNVIYTPDAPNSIAPYSQGFAVQNATDKKIVFTAGQIGMFPANHPNAGKLVSEDAAGQAKQTLQNVKNVVEAGGRTLANIVSVTVYITDFNDYGALNKEYAAAFEAANVLPENLPARAVVQVAGLPKGAKIEMQAIAVKA